MVVKQAFRFRDRGSFLNRMNPVVKLVLMALFCTAASTGNVFAVPVCFAIAVTLWIATGIPAGLLFNGGRFFLFLVAVTWLTDYVNNSDAVHALYRAASYLDVVLASLIFTDCTAPTDLARALGNRRLGAVAGLALAMIPMAADCISQTIDARKARGESMTRHPVRALTGICTCVVSDLLDRAGSYSDALIARGFGAGNQFSP